MIDVQRSELGCANGLLHGMHQRQQSWRSKHPVAAFDGPLEHVGDPVYRKSWKQLFRLSAEDGGAVDELAKPLPHTHKL